MYLDKSGTKRKKKKEQNKKKQELRIFDAFLSRIFPFVLKSEPCKTTEG